MIQCFKIIVARNNSMWQFTIIFEFANLCCNILGRKKDTFYKSLKIGRISLIVFHWNRRNRALKKNF